MARPLTAAIARSADIAAHIDQAYHWSSGRQYARVQRARTACAAADRNRCSHLDVAATWLRIKDTVAARDPPLHRSALRIPPCTRWGCSCTNMPLPALAEITPPASVVTVTAPSLTPKPFRLRIDRIASWSRARPPCAHHVNAAGAGRCSDWHLFHR
jgi:hypothetical protein